jgi:hypothetical protein
VQSSLANAGDIAVTATELRGTFALLSSPHRLGCCAELDAPAPRFPVPGCAFATPSRPEIRTVQPTGMSGGLESAMTPHLPSELQLSCPQPLRDDEYCRGVDLTRSVIDRNGV